MSMKLKAVLTFDYGSAKEARAVADALEPDNEGFVKTTISGRSMKAVVTATTAESLRHTLDDFLACLKVAEEAVGITGTARVKGKEEEEEDV
jgi:tRNA threonylcarbamoyladenosine modification (KEOPS) complex  Pcc1 subunit